MGTIKEGFAYFEQGNKKYKVNATTGKLAAEKLHYLLAKKGSGVPFDAILNNFKAGAEAAYDLYGTDYIDALCLCQAPEEIKHEEISEQPSEEAKPKRKYKTFEE